MKRFYCTVCQKMKRVRVYPLNVKNPKAENPQDRIGSCTRHAYTRTSSLLRKGA